MNDVLMAFIPMFFAMDPVGLVPIFAALTNGLDRKEKHRIIVQSLLTASLVAVGFTFLGRAIFNFLGITMGDFMVAGGLILFCLSMLDLTGQNRKFKQNSGDLGAVPIGTPLMVGPAVLTLILMLVPQHGVVPTLTAVFINLALTGILFLFAHVFITCIGQSGARALSKVMSLLLAAIGVMMVRRGLIEIITMVRT
jgi:multiple antibiotic resistance protein